MSAWVCALIGADKFNGEGIRNRGAQGEQREGAQKPRYTARIFKMKKVKLVGLTSKRKDNAQGGAEENLDPQQGQDEEYVAEVEGTHPAPKETSDGLSNRQAPEHQSGEEVGHEVQMNMAAIDWRECLTRPRQRCYCQYNDESGVVWGFS